MLMSDTHFPYHHPDYLEFLVAVKKKYKPTEVFHLGDLVDNAALNYHEKIPEMNDQTFEMGETYEEIQRLAEYFPVMKILVGNHDKLPLRKARTIGLHSRYIKDNTEVFDMPKTWTFHNEVIVNMQDGRDLMLRHNLTKHPFKTAEHYETCYAQGHYHEDFLVWWKMDNKLNVWGATVGSLVDDTALAMEYNKSNLKRPVLGCMVVQNGVPKLIEMKLKNKQWIGEID